MAARVKVLIGLVLALAVSAAAYGAQFHGQRWLRFTVYLLAVLLSSGMKVPLPKGESTMSVNFPFILLAIVQLSLPQALALAAISVFAQCNFRVQKIFTLVQIAFNVGNVVNATAAAWLVFMAMRAMHLPSSPALEVAVLAYFLTNTVPLAAVIGWSKHEQVFSLWRSSFLWYAPFYLVGAALSSLADFLSLRYGWATSLLVVPIAYTITRSYSAQVARARDREQHIREVESLHLRTIEGLAMAIEAKDQNTHDHLLRVRVYVREIGASLGLTETEMQAVLTAALLHDIGKLAVPEHIINKPGRLTQEEFEKMKIHPVVGAEILERVRFPYPVVPIVRSHHEWWNGMGYPDGLAGEAIPIGARILTVVDCFDALASDRPYRLAMPLVQAMEHVKSQSGTQFDPNVVAALESRYVELEERARREGEELARLDTEIAVERGAAPGAGFEQESDGQAMQSPGGSGGRPGHAEERGGALRLRLAEGAKLLLATLDAPGCMLTAAEVVSLALGRLAPALPSDCHVLYLRTGETMAPAELTSAAGRYFSLEGIPLGEGISGWVAHNSLPIVNGNPRVETGYKGDTGDELLSALSLPLLRADGGVVAVLTLYAKAENAFANAELLLLQGVAGELCGALERAIRPAVREISPPGGILPDSPTPQSLLQFPVPERVRQEGVLSTIAPESAWTSAHFPASVG